jgi:hypothetical protein
VELVNFGLRICCVICGYIVWRMAWEAPYWVEILLSESRLAMYVVRFVIGTIGILCAAAGVTLGV